MEFREVSGLALTPDGRVLLHNDEMGVVGAFDPGTGRIVATYRLGPALPADDFEGIAIAGDRLFLMSSGGRLYQTTLPGPRVADGAVLPYRVTNTRLGHLCELEGLTYDPTADELLLACKHPRKKSLRGQLTIFRWSLARAALGEPDRLVVPLDELARGRPGEEFRASALDRDPTTGHLVAIAGPEHAFAEIDSSGRVLATGKLGGHHRQAEGLAIAADGTILVSDEGNRRPGTVTVYTCR